jgi:hypothetical protein
MSRIPRMAWPPLACLALVAFLAVKGLIAYAGSPHPMAGLVWLMLASLGLVIGLALLGRKASIASRTRRYTMDPGGSPSAAIKHETAHATKGLQFGARIGRARVYPDGSGFVEVILPASATVAQDVAVDMAGARGEGASFWWSPHAAGDRANAAARTAHLTWDGQQRVYREAERMSHPRLFGSAGHIRRALERTGRYH